MKLNILFADYDSRAVPVKVWDDYVFPEIGGEISDDTLKYVKEYDYRYGGHELSGYGFCQFDLPLSSDNIYEMSVPTSEALQVRPKEWIQNIDPNPVCLFVAIEIYDTGSVGVVPFAVRDGEGLAITGIDDELLTKEIDRAAHLSGINPKDVHKQIRCIWFRLPYTESEMSKIIRPRRKIETTSILKPEEYQR